MLRRNKVETFARGRIRQRSSKMLVTAGGMMRKNSAFAATGVFSLTLAIGANTAIFSNVDAAMLRPLPLPQPERLFILASPDIEQPGSESLGDENPSVIPFTCGCVRGGKLGATGALWLSWAIGSPDPQMLCSVEHVIKHFVSGEGVSAS